MKIDAHGKMMRSIMLTMLMALSISSSIAQGFFEPVDWSFKAERLSQTEAKLVFTATIEEGWHLYSQHLDEGGPIPTSFTFQELGSAKLKGKVSEGEGHTEMDPNFEMEVKFFEDEADFIQLVTVGASATTVKGELEFMVCNDERCLPPDYVPFEFKIPEGKPVEKVEEVEQGSNEMPLGNGVIHDPVKWTFSQENLGDGEYELTFTAAIEENWHMYSLSLPEEMEFTETKFLFDSVVGAELVGEPIEPKPISEFDSIMGFELSFFEHEVAFKQKVRLLNSPSTIKGELEFTVCNDEGFCLPPELAEFQFELSGEVAEGSSTIGESSKANRSWLGIFIAGFFGGFLALLTPCVFPMIPLTVSFFTKQSKDRAKGVSNALIYGFFIIFIYVVLGFLVTVTFGADALNALSTNVWFNLFFFVLLVVFAISFLGAFEITLPSSWVNKADQASDRGGIIGIFFMAFTLSLVSFSCTGPIIGTLLVEAAVNGGVMGPIMGMTGFSLALALPFGLFAAFPGWLNSMPKSGGWLNSVKVVLGLLELALALKFLSNADLVVQAGLLKRELFLAIWIGIFGTLAMYLFGFIRFPHDSPVNNISIPRYLFGLVVLVFTIYLIPGLWGAPLKIISGFPPPNFYAESPNGFGGSGAVSSAITLTDDGDLVGDPEHCPHGLPCFHDYEEGLEYAKESGKPIMLDFTGWACVNCRKMEEQVWSDPRVLKRLREDFVLISLYVDEKLELPKDEQIEVTIGGKTKKLRTVGNKWSYMQAERYGNNSQPYYVILDHNENQLGPSAAYDPDIELYVNWLDAGKAAFESVN